MSYVRDNGLARARRRRERRSMAILGVCALLVVGAIIFAAFFVAKPASKSGACPNGTVSTPPAPEAAFITNVYNAGGAKGAASTAAGALKSHHFSVGVVGNDPYRKTISAVGEIRFGPAGAQNAKQYAAKYVPGASLVQDGRDGSGIDVVVGRQFPTIQAAPSSNSSGPHCK